MYDRTASIIMLQASVKVIYGLLLFVGLAFIVTNGYKTSAQAVDNPLITYANISRSENNLDPVLPNVNLTNSANAKAQDILEKQYFDHNSPDGLTPWYFIKSNNYKFTYAGENLAMGFSDYREAHNAWLNSKEHRDNILRKEFKEIGIGIARGTFNGEEVIVIVEMFGGA